MRGQEQRPDLSPHACHRRDEHEVALVHGGSGRRLQLGDPLSVTVGSIDAARGRVDLESAAAG